MKRRIALHAVIDAPIDDVAEAFEDRARDRRVLTDTLRVKFSDDMTVGRRVEVSTTGTRRSADGVVCEIHVRAQRHERAFPSFDGTLIFRRNGGDDTVVWLFGDYEHPLGRVGSAVGAFGGERLARESLEATSNALVDELANDARQVHDRWRPSATAEPLVHRTSLG